MWETKFDSSLNQVYYVDSDDGSVLFDLPCEVHTGKSKPKCHTKAKLISKITSALSLRKLKSAESKNESCLSVSSGSEFADSYYTPPLVNPQMHLTLEDSYMLETPLNLYNSDVSSVSSDESVQSFFSNIESNDIYFDHEHSIYYDSKSLQYIENDFDKERERHELRLQIFKELY